MKYITEINESNNHLLYLRVESTILHNFIASRLEITFDQDEYCSFFIPYTHSSLFEWPIERGFDEIALIARTAPKFGVLISEQRLNLAVPQGLANLFLGIIGTVRKCFLKTFAAALPQA